MSERESAFSFQMSKKKATFNEISSQIDFIKNNEYVQVTQEHESVQTELKQLEARAKYLNETNRKQQLKEASK